MWLQSLIRVLVTSLSFEFTKAAGFLYGLPMAIYLSITAIHKLPILVNIQNCATFQPFKPPLSFEREKVFLWIMAISAAQRTSQRALPSLPFMWLNLNGLSTPSFALTALSLRYHFLSSSFLSFAKILIDLMRIVELGAAPFCPRLWWLKKPAN